MEVNYRPVICTSLNRDQGDCAVWSHLAPLETPERSAVLSRPVHCRVAEPFKNLELEKPQSSSLVHPHILADAVSWIGPAELRGCSMKAVGHTGGLSGTGWRDGGRDRRMDRRMASG